MLVELGGTTSGAQIQQPQKGTPANDTWLIDVNRPVFVAVP